MFPSLARAARPFRLAPLRYRSGRPILALDPAKPVRPPLLPAADIDIDGALVYEDTKLLIVDKPSGFAIQGAYGSTARIKWDGMMEQLRKRESSPAVFPVHRLDKCTTGILVLAKSEREAKALGKQWAAHTIERTYLGVLNRGDMVKGEVGVINHKLRVDPDRVSLYIEGETVFGEGKDTETHYVVVDSSTTHTLIKFTPKTGRKHQLRLHAAEILKGSIVGDYKYGPPGDGVDFHRAILDFPADTMLLHSFSIQFHTWNKNGKRNTIEASVDPPAIFTRFCRLAMLDISLIRPPSEVLPQVTPIEEVARSETVV